MTTIPSNAPLNLPKSTTHKPLLITTGEPAGIGMDIVLELARSGQLLQLQSPVLVLADERAMLARLNKLNEHWQTEYSPNWLTLSLPSEDLSDEAKINNMVEFFLSSSPVPHQAKLPDFYLLNVPCQNPVQAGELDVANAHMVMTQLNIAHTLARNHVVSAIVTAPLQKSVLIDAGCTLADGSMFTGHTEFFMQQSGVDKVVMMLANAKMKVALVTTHLPLRAVADAITPSNVRQTVQITLDDLQQKFGIAQPKILVCGLNPHAGEGGHLGDEEQTIMDPVLAEFQQQGVDISSAMPADTLFTARHLDTCDTVIAMYHDQGLPVLKSHGFGDTVNLTLGLPYIRTSVDHGTALDLAGTGKASASSLWQALLMAEEMANKEAA